MGLLAVTLESVFRLIGHVQSLRRNHLICQFNNKKIWYPQNFFCPQPPTQLKLRMFSVRTVLSLVRLGKQADFDFAHRTWLAKRNAWKKLFTTSRVSILFAFHIFIFSCIGEVPNIDTNYSTGAVSTPSLFTEQWPNRIYSSRAFLLPFHTYDILMWQIRF